MKKKLGFFKILILAVILSISTASSVMAYVEKTNMNISRQALNELIMELSQDITTRGTEELNNFLIENNEYISDTEIVNLRQTKEEVGTIDGTVTDCEVYYTTSEYSSTSDTVIIADLKIKDTEHGFNQLYLIEYHVDKYGKIYGHNIWVY